MEFQHGFQNCFASSAACFFPSSIMSSARPSHVCSTVIAVILGTPIKWTLDRALIQVERTLPVGPIMDAVTATPSATAEDLVERKRREASARSALEILSAGKAGAYEAALAELDEPTRTSWQEQFAAELEDPDEDEDMDGEVEPYRADATGLAKYLECSVLPDCAQQREQVATRFVIQPEVLSEAFDCERLERLGRHEVHLDRKLERMLAMLLRLQSLRRSNESG